MNQAVRQSENGVALESAAQIQEVWHAYFDDEFSPADRRSILIQDLIQILRTREGMQLLTQVYLKSSLHVLPVDFSVLSSISTESSWLAALQSVPTDAITCLEAAAHQVLSNPQAKMMISVPPLQVNVRLQHYHDSKLELRNLKANFLDKLVSISGVVVRVSIVKPLVEQLEFTCIRCGVLVQQQLSEGRYVPPQSCPTEGCRNRTFIPNKKEAIKADFQKIRLQELVSGTARQEGRVPRTVECELTQDLVDSCLPGDLVTVCGIVKFINKEMDIGGHGKSKNLYNLYIGANSVVNKKNMQRNCDAGQDGVPTAIYHFPKSELENIVQYVESHGPGLFRQIVQSICPAIYGHELVKAGMALALFGGVQKHTANSNKVPVRGDLHVLVVGDPGLGKSQLLKAASSCAPRGIYVCGNSTSTAGLTVAVVKDTMSGDFIFEAGAMVLANGGVCCIDEFDKMPAEHQALLEAMEQQSVSVAKAGLVANLTARTSILAAANPIGGHYNRAKTVNENLKMSAALLSRFDLVFILLDKPDELRDQKLSEHVMAMHAGSKRRRGSAKSSNFLAHAAMQTQQSREDPRLAERLQLDPGKDRDFEPLKPQHLRKYIAYAKQYVRPRLTEEACHILQSYYLQLRQHGRGADGTPITARQLESLVRLAEARARVELREEVTEQDAQDVVDLMSESLYDKLVDENGHIDIGRNGGMSKSKETKRFMEHLSRLAKKEDRPCYTRKELAEIADDMGLNVPNLDDVIEKMNEAGFLLKKSGGKYEVQP